jgi:hypothetical protein
MVQENGDEMIPLRINGTNAPDHAGCTEVGGDVRRNRALNCWPWVRSLTHTPKAVIHSPAAIAAAWPTTVTTSRCPRALAHQNAETILGIMVGVTLDEAGQHFLR